MWIGAIMAWVTTICFHANLLRVTDHHKAFFRSIVPGLQDQIVL